MKARLRTQGSSINTDKNRNVTVSQTVFLDSMISLYFSAHSYNSRKSRRIRCSSYFRLKVKVSEFLLSNCTAKDIYGVFLFFHYEMGFEVAIDIKNFPSSCSKLFYCTAFVRRSSANPR